MKEVQKLLFEANKACNAAGMVVCGLCISHERTASRLQLCARPFFCLFGDWSIYK
jgi:hypothetical protein